MLLVIVFVFSKLKCIPDCMQEKLCSEKKNGVYILKYLCYVLCESVQCSIGAPLYLFYYPTSIIPLRLDLAVISIRLNHRCTSFVLPPPRQACIDALCIGSSE